MPPKGVPPQMLFCSLCGQQFGSSSLKIHIPQCYAKKMKQWEAGDPETRGKKPRDPSTIDMSAVQNKEDFNNQQFEQFSANMEQCDTCGRKFLPDRLVVHKRSCKGGGVGSKPVAGRAPPNPSGRPPTQGSSGGGGAREASPERPKTSNRDKGVPPQMLFCSLCGQQFGSSSLKIHIPQCYAKKMKQWEAGDPETRGKKPRDPSTIDMSAVQNKEDFNNQQFEQFSANMEQCENCGRKFLPDRLVVHKRSCKGGGVGSKPVAGRAGASAQEGKASTVPTKPTAPAPPPGRAQTSGRPAASGLPSGAGPSNGGASSSSAGNAPSGNLPPKLRALRQILFDDADENADGVIDLGELRRLVKDVEEDCSESDINTLMSSLDLNQDGVISREEWEAAANKAGGSAHKARGPLTNRRPAGTSSIKERVCSSCGVSEHDPNAKFCSGCGTPLTSDDEVARCGSCTAVLPYNARFCAECGAKTGDGEGGDTDAGDDEGMEIVSCPACGNGCDSSAKHCDECGAPMSGGDEDAGGEMICEPCGEIFSSDSRFCEECGGELIPVKDCAKANAAPPAGSAAKWAKQTRMDLPPVDQTTRSAGGGGGYGHGDDGDDADDDEQQDDSAPPQKGYAVPDDAAPPATDDDREPCRICGRKFLPDVLPRHMKICEKQASKKPRVFDSRKARIEGTDLASVKATSAPPPKPKSDWKAKSNAFRESMKAARVADKVLKAGGTAKDLPPPTYSDNSHLTPCPHCGRRFNADVAERHIPKCKNTINKPKAPPRRR